MYTFNCILPKVNTDYTVYITNIRVLITYNWFHHNHSSSLQTIYIYKLKRLQSSVKTGETCSLPLPIIKYNCTRNAIYMSDTIKKVVLTFITLTCFRNTSVLTVRQSYDLSLCKRSTRILMADCEKEITACGNFI